MIVTENLLNKLCACQEGIDWAVQSQAVDKEHTEFIQALWDDRQSEWYLWAKEAFATVTAITSVDHEYFGPYRVQNEYFDTLEEAQQKVLELCRDYNREHDYLYSVNAHIVTENNDVTICPCDIYSDHAIASGVYEAFNHETGLYIKFSTYAEARAYALQKKAEREAITNQQFFIEQQVREVGGTTAAWARL